MSFSQALAQGNLDLTSPAFGNNRDIPYQYTCTGSDVNPPLVIRNIPAHTLSLVLIVHDPDAPAGDWVHWAVYNITPQTKIIVENSVPGNELLNDFGQFHYGGPCPPDGKAHHYIFELYAVDTNFTMNENGSAKGLLEIIKGHILDKTQLVGIYKK